MTDKISTITASPDSIANDGSESARISASVLTDGAPAAAGVTVYWGIMGGYLDEVSSLTDNTGTATTHAIAIENVVRVTAKTDTDSIGKSVTLSTYQPLTAPTVVNATVDDDFTLDHYDINFGVQAKIPLYAGMDFNDSVTFHWGTVDSVSFIVTENNLPPYIIDVSHEMSPDCLKNGQYDVYYQVIDGAGNALNSSKVHVNVADDGQIYPTLPEPLVPEADPYINIADASNGVTITVSYPEISPGDVISTYCTGYDKYQREIPDAFASDIYTVVEGDSSHNITLDRTVFFPRDEGYEGYAMVYYTVMANGSSVLQLSETKICLVDTLAP